MKNFSLIIATLILTSLAACAKGRTTMSSPAVVKPVAGFDAKQSKLLAKSLEQSIWRENCKSIIPPSGNSYLQQDEIKFADGYISLSALCRREKSEFQALV